MGNGASLLLADPDEELGRALARALADEGVAVTVSPDGAEALLHVGTLNPDVVLVSATLPVVGAVDFVRVIRRALAIPVILGVGEGDAEDAVRALAAGATACVARPYRLPELLPLVRTARASVSSDGESLAVGHIELDTRSYQVRVDGRPVHLPLREFELLQYLMVNADRVVTREQISRNVWRAEGAVSTNTIAVHIKRLRGRLGDDDSTPTLIQTVRGVGYRLISP